MRRPVVVCAEGDRMQIVAGSTVPGATAWQVYDASGIYVDVDTSAAGFSRVPIYVTSLGGHAHHWETTGGSSVYQPTAGGFRVYVRFASGVPLTPAYANSNAWVVSWIGVVN
jgi:hypothetical protein